MFDDTKPNPDELLRAIQEEEKQNSSGRLKIFFGMSAGVGKTYAMLESAQQSMREGINVVVGTVNTHGRKETEALLQDLTVIPEKWVKYKDTIFEELDLETLIQLKPSLVIVDELAHTNVPGSKHSKRWQDVLEILDAGIDVYTTLNVQHIESRKDLIEGITGIQIRETVPDSILERASSIELIDVTPPDLLRRLKEGKVYLGEQSQIAARNFFKEESLTALREIALRFTAEKVDHDLHGMLFQGKRWKTRERLLVAVSSSPSSQYLIREARRLSFELDAPWIAVHVDTGIKLSDVDQSRLINHLNLARDLGAEVITTYDLDVTHGIQRIAGQKDVTRIVIGRPPRLRRGLFNLYQESFLDRLETSNKYIDIIILRQDKMKDIYQKFLPSFKVSSSWHDYGIACLVGVLFMLMGYLLSSYVGYKSIGYLFLLGILILTFFVGQGPVFFASIISAISWDLFFIPPKFSLWISDPEDIFLVITYMLTAIIMGALTTRIRKQDQFLQRREEKMERLFEIEKDIANTTNIEYLRQNIVSRLEGIFSGEFDILVKTLDDRLNLECKIPVLADEKEQSAAIWVFKNGKVGGWSTDTLPSAEAIYFPIKFFQHTNGVLVYHPRKNRSLSSEEMDFIQTVTQQIGNYLERKLFEEKLTTQDFTIQTEKLHKAIFNSLNRSLCIPLDKTLDMYKSMDLSKMEVPIKNMLLSMKELISNARFTVQNVIAISEMESGFFHFEQKKNSIRDVIEKALKDVHSIINGHKVEIQIPSQPLYLSFDYNLLKLAIANLLLNALKNAPSSTEIKVQVEVGEKDFTLTVMDEGQGIPEQILPYVFEKFYQMPGSKNQGMGLGLTVVKSIAEMHQGKVNIQNREGKGTAVTLTFPNT